MLYVALSWPHVAAAWPQGLIVALCVAAQRGTAVFELDKLGGCTPAAEAPSEA